MPAAQIIEARLLGGDGFKGDWGAKKAKAIGIGVASWLPSILVNSTSTGQLGTGVCTGTFTLNPVLLRNTLTTTFTSAGWSGSSLPQYSITLAKALMGAYTLTGASPAIAVGVFNVISVSSTSESLKSTLRASFTSAGFKGVAIEAEITALSAGISLAFNTNFLGTGAVAGVPLGTGAGTSPNTPLVIS